MSADTQGFDPSSGPGAGSFPFGATHGGAGGDNPVASYGTFNSPTSLGSGAAATSGGGAITLVATTLTVDGILSADGVGGGTFTDDGSAGGSLFITATTVTSTGSAGRISANGGNDGEVGGGGGRIGLATTTTFSFTGALQVLGGTGASRGFAGTISGLPTDLVIGGAGNLASLRLGADKPASNYAFNSLTVKNGGVLEIDGNPNLAAGGSAAAITVTTTVDVQTGGLLSATGLEFSSGEGPGGSFSMAARTAGGVRGRWRRRRMAT